MPQKIGFLLLGIFLFSFWGCKEIKESPLPMEFQLLDYPCDDGTAIILKWKHYNAFPTREYQVLRGETPQELKQINIKRLQTSFVTPQYDATDNLKDQDYYVVMENNSNPPFLKLIKATAQNKDSLIEVGEKVLFLEREVSPPDYDKLQLQVVQGDYYLLPEKNEEITKPDIIRQKGVLQKSPDGSFQISPGIGNLEIALEKRPDEIEFLKNTEIVRLMEPHIQGYLLKYGKKISGFITSNTRYSMSSIDIEYVDTGELESGKTYYYKLLGINKDNSIVESPLLSLEPQDNHPEAPYIDYCLYDPSQKKIFVSWFSPDNDLEKYSIFLTDPLDSFCVRGFLQGEFHSSWYRTAIPFQGAIEDAALYMITSDRGGQQSTTPLFLPEKFEMASLTLPPGLELVEPPNDQKGNVLSVRWDPPQLYMTYAIQDTAPPKIEFRLYPFEEKDFFLLQDTLNASFTLSQQPAESPEQLNMGKIRWVKESFPSEQENLSSKNLVITYDKAAHRGYIDRVLQKTGFVRVKLDNHKWLVDRNEIGYFKIKDLTPEIHQLTLQWLSSSGKPMPNPEALIKLDIDASIPMSYSTPIPDHYYEVFRFREDEKIEQAVRLDSLPSSSREYWDILDSSEYAYNYFLRVNSPSGGFIDSPVLGPLKSRNEIFDTNKASVFALMIVFVAIALFFFNRARKGHKFYIRPIAGIEHIDEALGRATEMGRPALFVLGLSTISDIATLAGLTVLGHVSRRAAKFNTRVLVPCCDPIVMLVAQESVKSACIEAGRPDSYREEDVFFITDDQFAYAAAVNGMMIRQKTATNLYMGMFYAEALLLAETGTRMGAIQIAGTDAVTQIPFFITTCDYTLIGEELYAASAYLSDDPIQVGSLKAQDFGKAIVVFLILLGIILMTFHLDWIYHIFTVITQ
ncbi:hypothetical protein JW877_00720 [bacterium]|nr:hypothetical protein [bacterium]